MDDIYLPGNFLESSDDNTVEREMSLESNLENSQLEPITVEKKRQNAIKLMRILPDGSSKNVIKATRSAFAQALLYLEKGTPFRLNGRDYLKQIYDHRASNVLMLCGRQVEKCVPLDSLILVDFKTEKEAGDIEIGDNILSLNTKTGKIEPKRVTWKSRILDKACLSISAKDYKAIMSTTHPVRTMSGWVEAGRLREGDIIAVVSRHCKGVVDWLSIDKIKAVGKKACIDFSVEDNSSFITNGIITHNSTSASAWSVTDCCILPNYQVLYVSPAADQTRNFSTQKIKPMMEDSPLVKKYFISNGVEQQVFNKGFLNGSRIMLRYSFLTADRIRGISASKLCIDEIQDILMDNIPVIKECLSHAKNPSQLYTGTPKTFDNPLTKMWDASAQHEWVVKCSGCNHYNVLGIKNIGKQGPICSRCGKAIIINIGQWVRMTQGDGEFSAFRISQLMVEWKQSPERWHQDLILPMEGPNKIAENVYYNEKLGQPFDSADKPITQEEIIIACDRTENKVWRCAEAGDKRVKYTQIFGGVDWGTGSDLRTESGKKKHASYTVLTLLTMNREGRMWPFYFKKYTKSQADPNFIRDDILRLHHLFGVTLWGVDWGFGWMMNNQLMRDLPKRVIQFQYVPNQKQKRKWDPDGYKFQLNRSMVMSEFFTGIKRGEYQFPSWKEFEWVAQDILGVFKDFSTNPATRNQLYYNHPLDRPDDFLHSIIMARAAFDIHNGRP